MLNNYNRSTDVFRGNEDPFPSEEAADLYASNAGFTVSVRNGIHTASRSDMETVFTLEAVSGKARRSSKTMWAWVRPGFAAQYKSR